LSQVRYDQAVMTSADDEARRPPSRRIADDLREAIRRGDLGPGMLLPSSRELANTYGTARNTASEAIKILEGEGLVSVEHGRRPFVRKRTPLMRLGANRYSRKLRDESGLSPFMLEATKQGRNPHVEGRDVARIQPPQEVAERLNVPPNTRSVIRRENWYFSDGEPVQIGETYIPWRIAKGTPLVRPGEPIPVGIYAYLETLGYTMTQAREEITARVPTPEEAESLRIRPGVPIIEVLHTSISQDAEPFDVTRFILRADVMGLDYTIPIEE
jgi:GntR family transcriptional regulator